MNITFTKSFLRLKDATKKALIAVMVLGAGVFNAQAQTYCTATTGSNNCSGNDYTYPFFIGEVRLNTMNYKNSQTCPGGSNTGYYEYVKSATTTLTQGATYTIEIDNNLRWTQASTWTITALAWIDLNGDKTFQTSEAMAATSKMTTTSTPNKASTTSYTFTIPCSATPGVTRLRVRSNYSNAMNSSNACGGTPSGWGGTKDFDITIAPGNVTPIANYIIPDTIFEGSNAQFVNSNQIGYVHEWSVDYGSGFTVVSNATNLQTSFPTAGTYDVKLKSTNCQGSATVVKTVTVIAPTYAPTPKFVCSTTSYEVKPGTLYNGDADLYMYDLSTGGPSDWLWSFYSKYDPNDATLGYFFPSEYDPNPLLIFFDTTLLSVCMQVSNSIGTNSLCKDDYININYPQSSASGNKFENWMCRETSSTLDSGELYDTEGPNIDNSTNKFCTFTIGGCEVKDIKLVFSDFNLSYNQTLNIYDGKNASAPLLGSYRQTSTRPADMIAKSGNVYVEFITGGNCCYNTSGFKITWKSNYIVDGGPRANFTIPKTGGTDTVFACSVGSGNAITFNNISSGSQKFTEYQWIFDYTPNVSYPVGFNNSKAESPTYTYTTTNKMYNVRLVVESCEGRDTIIKSFYLATTTQRPVVDFVADETILFPDGIATISNMSKAGCGGKWTIAPADGWTYSSGNATADQIKVKFSKKGRYTITREETNDNGTTSKTKSEFIEVIDYCTPSSPYMSTEAGIAKVTFAGINNASSSGLLAYEDFTTLGAYDIVMGTTYTFTTSRTGNTDPADRRVWIDFDRNGDFSSNELVASEANSYNKDFTATIKIKGVGDVLPGKMRMRVACAISGYSISPCGPLKVGEYEDYMLNLKRDDQNPVITMLGNDPITQEVGVAYNDAGATAMDNLEGDITSRMKTDNQVDISQPGIYYVTYSVTDNSGNDALPVRRTVIVKADITNPVISINGGNTLTHEVHMPFVAPTASVVDNPGNTSINYIIASNNLDIHKLGTYQLVYEATDAYGNSSQEILTVEVKDQTAPVFHLNSANPYQIQLGTDFVDPTTVSDNYYSGSDITLAVSGATTINTNSPGEYIRNYTATDASGNTSTLSRTFKVSDFVAPTINTTAGTEYIVVEVNSTFTEPAVKALDNFGAASLTRTGSYDIHELGTYVITYTAKDAYGNTTVYTRTIKVVDTEKPVVTDKVLIVEQWSNFDANDFSKINVVDNYNNPNDFQNGTNNCKIVAVSNDVSTQDPGIYYACYVAIDGSNNQSDMKCLLVKVVGNTSGIEQNDFANSINVYPNPSNGQFSLNFANSVSSQVKVNITNLLGEVIATYNYHDMAGNKLSVNLDGKAAGVYFVNIEDNNAVATKKITITK